MIFITIFIIILLCIIIVITNDLSYVRIFLCGFILRLFWKPQGKICASVADLYIKQALLKMRSKMDDDSPQKDD